MQSIALRKEDGKSSGQRLLNLLKMRGPLSSAELGAALGVTGEAVRQQMARLTEEGLIDAEQERRGVGRPRQVWKLTSAGMARFPDAHAQTTIELIDEVQSRFGQDAVDKIIEDRGAKVTHSYVESLQGAQSLKEKVAALTQIRTDEGYMAEWHEESDGTLILIENHCAIGAVAKKCPVFCQCELESFQEALGGDSVRLERKEHMLTGSRRCLYQITPAARQSLPGQSDQV